MANLRGTSFLYDAENLFSALVLLIFIKTKRLLWVTGTQMTCALLMMLG